MNNEVSKEAIKLVKKNYYRNYRLNNKDKMQKAQERFWQKKAQEMLEEKQKNNKQQEERSYQNEIY